MDARLLLLIGVLVPFSFFTIILIVFMIRRKKIAKSQSAVLQRLINSESSKATSAFYQKMYNFLIETNQFINFLYILLSCSLLFSIVQELFHLLGLSHSLSYQIRHIFFCYFSYSLLLLLTIFLL